MCEKKTPRVPLAVVAAAAAAVAVAVAVTSVLLWVLIILGVADLALLGVIVAVHRDGGQMWRPPAAAKAPARPAVEARTAPLAIEAPRPVAYRITDLQEIPERRH